MKIGILTLRLANNYGGVLQAYALLKFLNSQGHEVVFFDRTNNRPFLKRILVRCFLPYVNYFRGKGQISYEKINTFIEKNIPRTNLIDSNFDFKRELQKRRIDAMIVGSDQVWRKEFVMNYGYNYYLDFVPKNIKKISYAASFGLSEWNYSQEETAIIKQYIKRFDAISVREDDAVILCNNYFNVSAKHVLDPTLLLTQDDYDKIVANRLVQEDYIFVYWLGDSLSLKKIISCLDGSIKLVLVKIEEGVEQISIEDWLSYIKYAKYVITDSFHGCAFSLIFGKQFKACMNESGGSGRLRSLFRMLNIENEVANQKSINYLNINKKLDALRRQSKLFLLEALK